MKSKKEELKTLNTFQLLIRLCAYVPAVEELARKDDLTLLFSAVTSPVPEHNLVRILIKQYSG